MQPPTPMLLRIQSSGGYTQQSAVQHSNKAGDGVQMLKGGLCRISAPQLTTVLILLYWCLISVSGRRCLTVQAISALLHLPALLLFIDCSAFWNSFSCCSLFLSFVHFGRESEQCCPPPASGDLIPLPFKTLAFALSPFEPCILTSRHMSKPAVCGRIHT